MTTKTIYIALLAWGSVAFCACDPIREPATDNFDRKAMLQNYADNLIKPAFASLQIKANALQAATDEFTNTVTEQNLATLQTAWKESYTEFQYTSPYNFGPVGEQGTRKKWVFEVATFPVNIAGIESKIAANTTSLNDFDRDARGFLAAEYLIFDTQSDNNAVLNRFSSTARRNYLKAVVANLKRQVDEVVTAWNGEYAAEFVGNDGTSAGSSTFYLFNEFVVSYEALKNFKLGLPLGKRPNQTQSAPELAEAYYSGQSLPMLGHHLNAIENLWHGRNTSGKDGIGFKEYLENVEGGLTLVANTEAQLAAIRTAQNAIPTTTPLSVQITTNPTPIENFYVEIQKNTKYFKSEMQSALDITLTDSGDTDGD